MLSFTADTRVRPGYDGLPDDVAVASGSINLETASSNGAVHDGPPAVTMEARPREIELKLLAPPGILDQLRDAPIIVQHARNKGVVRHLEAVYFDTADRRLGAQGSSLRVRRNGKRCIQTIKLRSDGQLSRPEWETPVAAMVPELGLFPLAEIGPPFETLAIDALSPIFTTRVRRQARTIVLPGATIEVAFDEGTVEAGQGTAPLYEIELELKAGDIGALYDFGLALLELAPLRVGTQSKAERGYALASHSQPAAERAKPSGVTRQDSVDAAIGKLLISCHSHMAANAAAAERGDTPDGVHQMRVALRRMRTALSLIHREIPAPCLKSLAGDAKFLASALGDARNWDVFRTSTVQDIANASLPGFDAAVLREAAEPFRQKSYDAVRDALAAAQTNRFVLSMGRILSRRAWRNDIGSDTLTILTEPVANLASRALNRLHRKALKQGNDFRALQPEARHDLRLTLKKLRYATEFFLPLYDERRRSEAYLKRLAQLQDALGVDNDVSTTAHLLQAIGTSSRSPEVHRALGLVAGWQGRDRLEAMKSLNDRWKAFRNIDPFWQG